MPWVGFDPTVPASERAKPVHALDSSATVTGAYLLVLCNREYIVSIQLINNEVNEVLALFVYILFIFCSIFSLFYCLDSLACPSMQLILRQLM
jgi:hypothetical protein